MGRFITEDPLKDGLNWLIYVSNNPLRYTDPTGLEQRVNLVPGYTASHEWFNSGVTPSAAVNDRITDASIPALPEEGPCLMRALQGVAETFAGKNLSESDIVEAIKELDKGTPPPVNKDDDFFVNDSKSVIENSLRKLDIDPSKLDIKIYMPGDTGHDAAKKNATASIRGVGRSNNPDPDEPEHFQEGDSKGDFVFDPISGESDGDRKNLPEYTRYITITKK